MARSLVFFFVTSVESVFFENMFETRGHYGTCMDINGNEYDGWSGPADFKTCEVQCEGSRDCVGFDYHHGGDGPIKKVAGWCELRYTDGAAPVTSPISTMRHSHFNHHGSGEVVHISSRDDFERICYAKRGLDEL